MGLFYYQALKEKGEKFTGVLQAENLEEAKIHLSKKNLFLSPQTSSTALP